MAEVTRAVRFLNVAGSACRPGFRGGGDRRSQLAPRWAAVVRGIPAVPRDALLPGRDLVVGDEVRGDGPVETPDGLGGKIVERAEAVELFAEIMRVAIRLYEHMGFHRSAGPDFAPFRA